MVSTVFNTAVKPDFPDISGSLSPSDIGNFRTTNRQSSMSLPPQPLEATCTVFTDTTLHGAARVKKILILKREEILLILYSAHNSNYRLWKLWNFAWTLKWLLLAGKFLE